MAKKFFEYLWNIADNETKEEIDDKALKKEENNKLPFTTPQFDPRFPHTNQTNRCFVNFLDYHRCGRLLGNYEVCAQFKKNYLALCPNEWIERWEDRIEEGKFQVNLPLKKEEEVKTADQLDEATGDEPIAINH